MPTLLEPAAPAAGPSRVLLIGMMGAGKSVASRLVASRLGWPHCDSDQQIEQRTGKSVAQIFSEWGEARFRAEESQTLAEVLGPPGPPGPLVLSLGGGAVLSADNRRRLAAAGLVVWLRADVAILAERVAAGDHRPLLAGDRLARLTQLYADRRPLYEALADVVIDVDGLTPGEVADQVVAALDAYRAPAAAGVGGAVTKGRVLNPLSVHPPVGGGFGDA